MRLIAIWLLMCGVACGQVEFDGVDQYISVDESAYLGTNSEFTISLWVDTSDNARTEYLMSRGDVDAVYQFRLYKSSTGLTYIGLRGVNSAIRLVCYADITYDGITHLCLQYFGGTGGTESFGLYANDQNVPISLLANNLNTDFYSSGKFYIGSKLNGATPFAGTITDARIYQRALSAEEISEIYHRPWSLTDDPSLVLRTCVVTNDTGSSLTGVAPNYGTGSDGTYSNSPTAAPFIHQFTKPKRATIP